MPDDVREARLIEPAFHQRKIFQIMARPPEGRQPARAVIPLSAITHVCWSAEYTGGTAGNPGRWEPALNIDVRREFGVVELQIVSHRMMRTILPHIPDHLQGAQQASFRKIQKQLTNPAPYVNTIERVARMTERRKDRSDAVRLPELKQLTLVSG